MNRTAGIVLATALPSLALAEDAPAAPGAEDAGASAEQVGPITYTVDATQTVLIVRTYKGGLGSALAHDHAIRSMKTTGTVAWQPGGEGCNFDITVDVPSFRLDDTADRQRLGLPGEVDDNQKADVTKNMMAEDQLNVAVHKTMSFKATRCTENSVAGMLTIVGKSSPKKVPLTITADGDTLRAQGTLEFKHSDFGITPYSLAGFVKNKDQLSMTIDLKAKK